MNSSVINSTFPFNHSSSGSSLQLSNAFKGCTTGLFEFVFAFIERSINLVVGYPANIMVMWLVAREKSDSSTSNIFIFNLAIADALLCVMIPICYYGFYMFRIPYFAIISGFITGIKNTSPLFLTCICLDRYVAVVHPIVFNSIKDKKIRVAVSMLVWGLMITTAAGRLFWMDHSGDFFTGLILAAFAIMVFCNVSIIWSLRKSVLGKEKMHPMKKKAFSTVQIYLGMIVFHYLPVVIIMLFTQKPDFQELCHVERIMFSIMYFSSSTSPLLYILKIKQLPWLKNLLCICCRSSSPE